MQLKRLHDHLHPDTGEVLSAPMIDPDSGEVLSTPRLRKVIRVQRAGPRQKFTPELVMGATAEGWMSLDKGVIVIHGEDGDVRYRIDRSPGYYCCHCGMALESAGDWTDETKTATRGMVHVSTEHPDIESPDPGNPSGYERLNAFDCTKEG